MGSRCPLCTRARNVSKTPLNWEMQCAVRGNTMLSHTSAAPLTRYTPPPLGVRSRDVASLDRAIELVAPYCDIVDRLKVIPPSAQARGVWLKNIENQVERLGEIATYREYFPNDHYSSLSFYPVADVIIRSACAGALVASPERVHEGMVIISKGNAESFMASLLGRMMLRVFSRDPVRLLEQGLAARRQSTTYGHWELRRHSEREVEMVYQNEYWWIESALTGAALGTFEACKISARIETKLIDRFNGSTFFRW
jgi:uncharacterized protein (TIGR02265 family)